MSLAVIGLATLAIVSSRSSDARWLPVGALERVNDAGVLALPALDLFVVANPGGTPVTLIGRSPQMGEPVVYCPTSMWFEDPAHGSKFDRLGRYAIGPAPRGLDRLPTIVRDGLVLVDPSRTILGPPRQDHAAEKPAGPFCVTEDP